MQTSKGGHCRGCLVPSVVTRELARAKYWEIWEKPDITSQGNEPSTLLGDPKQLNLGQIWVF